MKGESSTTYDRRKARKLSGDSEQKPRHHRLSKGDWALIQKYAGFIASIYPNAKLIAFHSRRKRFVWQCGKNTHIIRPMDDCNWFAKVSSKRAKAVG